MKSSIFNILVGILATLVTSSNGFSQTSEHGNGGGLLKRGDKYYLVDYLQGKDKYSFAFDFADPSKTVRENVEFWIQEIRNEKVKKDLNRYAQNYLSDIESFSKSQVFGLYPHMHIRNEPLSATSDAGLDVEFPDCTFYQGAKQETPKFRLDQSLSMNGNMINLLTKQDTVQLALLIEHETILALARSDSKAKLIDTSGIQYFLGISNSKNHQSDTKCDYIRDMRSAGIIEFEIAGFIMDTRLEFLCRKEGTAEEIRNGGAVTLAKDIRATTFKNPIGYDMVPHSFYLTEKEEIWKIYTNLSAWRDNHFLYNSVANSLQIVSTKSNGSPIAKYNKMSLFLVPNKAYVQNAINQPPAFFIVEPVGDSHSCISISDFAPFDNRYYEIDCIDITGAGVYYDTLFLNVLETPLTKRKKRRLKRLD